jgi:hypothetical protein
MTGGLHAAPAPEPAWGAVFRANRSLLIAIGVLLALATLLSLL